METSPSIVGLSQSGRPTDICVGADYWQLQPRFLENEWGGGSLKIYRSAFGCGFILRGELPPPRPVAARRQELPEVKESGGHPAAAEESGGHPVTAEQEPAGDEEVQPEDVAVGLTVPLIRTFY